MIVDMHCDTFSKLLNDKLNHKDYSILNNPYNIDLQKLQKSNYLLQNFAMFVPLEEVDDPYDYCNQMIDLYYEEINKYPDIIKPVYCYKDIIDNQNNHLMSSLLTIEEGNVINDDLNNLDYFYQRGVRMITLTWNYYNHLGYPNLDLPIKEFKDIYHINKKDGLTPLGLKYIKKMEELGIIIDVSHLSDAGFYDVYNNTTKPFVASHSNARSVCGVARNMSDDMIKKLASRGGVMGINFCGDFLKESENGNVKSCIEDMIKHIDYIVNLVGIDYIGLGTDFDGIDCELEIKDASYLDMLVEALKNHHYSNDDIDKILYKNVLNLYQKVLKDG